MKRLLLLLLFLTATAWGQGANTLTRLFAGAPSGACGPFQRAINSATGDDYNCLAGVWHLVAGGGGSGTVTNTGGALTLNQIMAGAGGNDSKVSNLTGDVTTSGSMATTLTNIPTATPAAGSVVHTNIAAPASPAAGKDSLYTDSTDLRLHDKNASGVIGTTVVADTGAANNFLTAISAAGGISKAQPSFSNLSGSAAAGQMPALTGDVTMTAGQTVTVLANIPTGATAAGSILHTNIAAPGSPASGKDSIYTDSTDLRLHDKNASGVIGTTVVADTGASNNFLTAISAAGVVSKSRPTLDQLAAAAASATYADGNFILTFNNAQTTNTQNAVTFGETSAATNGTLTNGLGNQTQVTVSTASASTAVPLSVLQGSITSTTAFPALQIQTTWNNASLIATGILFNVTDTNSSASSNILDLRKGNTTQFKVDKTGNATMTSSTTNGSFAGGLGLTGGPDNSNISNTAIFEAPASVTAYREMVPNAAPVNNNSAMIFSNVTPGVGTWAKMSQTAFLTSAYTNATTTFSNVTGLSFPVEANTNYKLQCDLDYQASATTADVKIQWTGPASPTFLVYDLVTEVTASTLSSSVNPATATTTGAFSTSLSEAGTPTTATNFPLKLTMTLINGVNAGTVQLQAAAVGAGTVTILPGSCELQ